MAMPQSPQSPQSDEHVTKWVARPARSQEEGWVGTAKTILRVMLVMGATASSLFLACLIKVFVCPVDCVVGRRWMDRFVVAAWADGVVGGPILPRGPKLKLSGELPRPDGRAGILIANHQLDTDWFYLWDMLRVVGAHGALKIVLLDDMRTVPILGWAMRLVGFIFVSRHRRRARPQDDVAEIARGVAEIAEGQSPSLLLLFPEGTTVSEEAKRKSEAYAARAKRPAHELLLVPHVGGFVAACRGFASRGVALDELLVYDSTMAYAGYRGEVPAWDLGFERADDVELPNAAKLFKGQHGDHVRLHTVAYRAAEIFADDGFATPLDALKAPEAESIAQRWLDARWVEKDARMTAYAADGDFADDGDVVLVQQPAMMLPFACLTAGWLSAVAAAACAVAVAMLLALPVFLLAGLAAGVACLVMLPCLCVGTCVLAPAAAAGYLARHMYLHDLGVATPLAKKAPRSDSGFDDDDESVDPEPPVVGAAA